MRALLFLSIGLALASADPAFAATETPATSDDHPLLHQIAG